MDRNTKRKLNIGIKKKTKSKTLDQSEMVAEPELESTETPEVTEIGPEMKKQKLEEDDDEIAKVDEIEKEIGIDNENNESKPHDDQFVRDKKVMPVLVLNKVLNSLLGKSYSEKCEL